MGAWGAGPFENDAARDWLIEVALGTEDIRATLDRTVASGGALDAYRADQAMAAVTLVAMASEGEPLPEPLDEQLAVQRDRNELRERLTDPEIIELAARAIDRIGASESAELWAEEPLWWESLAGAGARLGVAVQIPRHWQSARDLLEELGSGDRARFAERLGALRPELTAAVSRGERQRFRELVRELRAALPADLPGSSDLARHPLFRARDPLSAVEQRGRRAAYDFLSNALRSKGALRDLLDELGGARG